MPSPGDIVWTEELVQALLDLSEAGLSRSQIGARLGCSKGCVCGIVRRLALRGIRVSSNPASGTVYDHPRPLAQLRRHHTRIGVPPPPAKTLEPLATVVGATRRPAPVMAAPKPRATVPPPEPPSRPATGGCQFISGEKRPWVFCCEPCVNDTRNLPTAWCRKHYKQVFAARPALREEAA